MRYEMSLVMKRDAELTLFKRFAIENQNLPTHEIVEKFNFVHIDVEKTRQTLIDIARYTIRYPHRIPR